MTSHSAARRVPSTCWRRPKRTFKNDDTASSYGFLEELMKFRASAGGLKMIVQKEQSWAELMTDDRSKQLPETVIEQAAILTNIVGTGGNVTIEVATTHFAVSYTHLRAHETDSYLVCRLLLEKK